MAQAIHESLKTPCIREPMRFLNEYSFRLDPLETTIRIRLFELLGTEGVHFSQSHFMKLPESPTPYMTSRPWGMDEADALRVAVNSIVAGYSQAIEKGYKPSKEWLVANAEFADR